MLKAVLFDLDGTLYDTRRQVDSARRNAVKAMMAAGLDVDEEEALTALSDVVLKRGPNFQHHYDEMLEVLGFETDPKIIAAGIVAYHETKTAYLVPYPDTVSTLLELRDLEYKLAVVTDGVPVKQWEKLIRLGLKDFFHTVIVSSSGRERKPSKKPFQRAAASLGVREEECMMVGDNLERDVRGGNNAGMKTVQLLTNVKSASKPESEDMLPDYIITELKELIPLLEGEV
ncbi:MAG: TIGR02253 family HAD-type hydrolase [Candidatus Altiarchaeales archaeon]|nr:TIGR02253 family HAD-type hydrolase [Candidatus Altiarchaeales archaeon]MBD3416197.1 TIGR02253 family HAD-type hydrolase [Candidatus Altiarchaeales archaeon]